MQAYEDAWEISSLRDVTHRGLFSISPEQRFGLSMSPRRAARAEKTDPDSGLAGSEQAGDLSGCMALKLVFEKSLVAGAAPPQNGRRIDRRAVDPHPSALFAQGRMDGLAPDSPA
jgi:hypothetical protein